MAKKSSTLCIASREPGRCGDCRHANQGTVDFAEQHVFCSWGGAGRPQSALCNFRLPLPVDVSATSAFVEVYLYQQYDGMNCTWGKREDTRLLAPDASPALRTSLKADQPFIPADE
ncbi:MAG: hypothetical protein ABI588_08690 [Arenimonas sp.]